MHDARDDAPSTAARLITVFRSVQIYHIDPAWLYGMPYAVSGGLVLQRGVG